MGQQPKGITVDIPGIGSFDVDPTASAPEPKSLSGFLGNIPTSAGHFAESLINPVLHPQQTYEGLKTAVSNPRATLSAAGSALKNRYGSLDAVGNTAYQDPVGMLGDLSLLLTGAGGAAGLAGKLGEVDSLANAGRLLTGVGDVTNPIRAVTAPAKAIASEVSLGPILGTTRPSRALRDEFGGGRAIAKTIRDRQLFSEGQATSARNASSANLDAALGDLEQQGIGVTRRRVVQGLRDARDLTQKDVELGLPDRTPAIADRARAIRRRGPGEIPIRQAQDLKTRAQDLAFEARQQNLSVPQAENTGLATALKEGIEEAGVRGGRPDIKAINAETQRLIGAQGTWQGATDRPHALTNLFSTSAGAALGAATDPTRGVMGGLALRALDAPHVGVGTGIVLNELGKFLDLPTLVRLGLIERGVGAGLPGDLPGGLPSTPQMPR